MACDYPITIVNPRSRVDKSAAQFIPVPCRKCPPCLAKRSNGWIFRLLQQDKVSQAAYFVTFTYETKNLPHTEKGFATLQKRDFQLFMKRLRKATKNGKLIKYYAVGEYGSTTYRPHYHAIIFNCDPELLEKTWGLGHVHTDRVNGNTVAYTCKYMHKGKLIPVHANDDRTPEFQLVSKGIGLSYINNATIDWHNNDISRNYVVGEGGVKIPMPRIYRHKIFSESRRRAQARNVQQLVLEQKENRIQKFEQEFPNENYYRSETESKKQSLAAFKNRLRDRNAL